MTSASVRLGMGAALLAMLAGCQDIESDHGHERYFPKLATKPAQETPPLAASREKPMRVVLSSIANKVQGGWMRGQFRTPVKSAQIGGVELALDAEGRFFAGFDRDAPSEVMLTAELADGSQYSKTIRLAAGEWQIEHVNVARRPSGSSAAFLKRRKPEIEAIYSAREQETGARGWRQQFIWPVKGRISGRFGSQRIYRGEPGSYHTGMDISTGEAGTPFVAPADGVVVLAAQNYSLEGNLLIIDHGQGLNSAFLHSSRLAVKEGEEVKQGELLGYVGMSGRATGPHLHWSIKWRNARLDPLLFVEPSVKVTIPADPLTN